MDYLPHRAPDAPYPPPHKSYSKPSAAAAAGAANKKQESVMGSIYASTVLSMYNDEEEDKTSKLNDQQWILQRKKIGLSRRTKQFMSKVIASQNQTQSVLEFITGNFSRKECCHFVADPKRKERPRGAVPGPKDSGPCHCGAPIEEHKSRAAILRSNKEVHAHFAPIREEDYEEDDEDDEIKMEEEAILEDSVGAGGIIHLPGRIDSGNDEILMSGRSPTEDEKEYRKKKKRNSKKVHYDEKYVDPSTRFEPTPTRDSQKTGDWVEERDVQEFPTNAFGQIEFVNEDEGSIKPSKYLRLSDKTPIHLVKELLVDHWHLFQPSRPHLALSLIGGAKNFRMEGRKKEIFKKGLIGAARSTNALILTGGTNTGTMKLVGDAVSEGQFLVQNGEKMTNGIKLMGLCPFGYLRDMELFINPNPKEFNLVTYNSNVEIKHGENVPLNGDHTHFLLIDDGSRYRFFGAYTNFITKFETMVRDPEPKGLGIPIVTLLLEGGKDAIRIVKDRLREGIACVVIEGSGRAADIISYAYKNTVKNEQTNSYTLKEGHIAHLMKMLDTEYGGQVPKSEKNAELQSIMNWTIECIRYSHIITIFDIRRETQLDKKILSALLKSDKMDLHHQLFLSMVWDRIDLVEEKILDKDTLNTMATLDDVMTQALQMERVKFIELLVMNGFVMRTFLTVEKLRELYNDSASRFKEFNFQLRSLTSFKGSSFHLWVVHKLLTFFLKDHVHHLYKMDMPLKGPHVKKKQVVDVSKKLFDEPYVELFIWAVFSNKPLLIDFCWERCSQPILQAVVAAAVYSKLVYFYKGQNLPFAVLQKRKALFQERANMLMQTAYESDQTKAISLLEKRNKRWGGNNLMQLGTIGHLRAFIANPTCQHCVQISWKRGFTRLPWYSCLLGWFLPFLVWTPMVTFVRGLGDDGGDLNPFQKLFVFYRAPVIKYVGICISFFALIVLYSYVSLFGFRFEYHLPEVVLYAWLLINIFDELREVFLEPSKSLKGKISDYMNSVWNRFDVLMYTIAIVSLVLKNFPQTFTGARILFAFNAALFYVRVFRMYHANRNLGPKLVIFHRMIPEIVTFLLLLCIFILGYGVASQSLVDPYRVFSWSIIPTLMHNVFFQPYLQMFGDLNLDALQVQPTNSCLTTPTQLTFIPNASYSACYPDAFEDLDLYNTFIEVILAVYLLVGNVMLLNLLIAIFTSVFDSIHQNSNEVWKWEMYRLVEECDQRPGLAPPLVIIEDVFKLFKGIWKKTCRKEKENLDLYMQETLDTLKLFERDCMSSFMANEAKEAQDSLESRMVKLEQKTDQLLELFEDAPDDDANWGETIDMEKKLFETPDFELEEEEEVVNTVDGFRRAVEIKKKLMKKSTFQVEPVEEADPRSARISTGRSARMSRAVMSEMAGIRTQLERLEEQRRVDAKRLERANEDLEDRLERIIRDSLKGAKW